MIFLILFINYETLKADVYFVYRIYYYTKNNIYIKYSFLYYKVQKISKGFYFYFYYSPPSPVPLLAKSKRSC